MNDTVFCHNRDIYVTFCTRCLSIAEFCVQHVALARGFKNVVLHDVLERTSWDVRSSSRPTTPKTKTTVVSNVDAAKWLDSIGSESAEILEAAKCSLEFADIAEKEIAFDPESSMSTRSKSKSGQIESLPDETVPDHAIVRNLIQEIMICELELLRNRCVFIVCQTHSGRAAISVERRPSSCITINVHRSSMLFVVAQSKRVMTRTRGDTRQTAKPLPEASTRLETR